MAWWQRPAGLTCWLSSRPRTSVRAEGSAVSSAVCSVVSRRPSVSTAAPALVASYSVVDMFPHFSRSKDKSPAPGPGSFTLGLITGLVSFTMTCVGYLLAGPTLGSGARDVRAGASGGTNDPTAHRLMEAGRACL